MSELSFRDAEASELGLIVDMLMDDPLGATREDNSRPLDDAYRAGFAAFQASDRDRLIVAVRDGGVVGCMQLHFLPGIAIKGMSRGQIEGVRVAATARGEGLGEAMIAHAIALFRAYGCGMVQLTTNVEREDARRFYERLGFIASHAGMKLNL